MALNNPSYAQLADVKRHHQIIDGSKHHRHFRKKRIRQITGEFVIPGRKRDNQINVGLVVSSADVILKLAKMVAVRKMADVEIFRQKFHPIGARFFHLRLHGLFEHDQPGQIFPLAKQHEHPLGFDILSAAGKIAVRQPNHGPSQKK